MGDKATKLRDIPWKKVNDLVLACGATHSPRDMVDAFLRHVGALVPYDSARAFLITDDGRIESVVSYGVEAKWLALYERFYSETREGRYSLFTPSAARLPGYEQRGDCAFMDWSHGIDDLDFLSEYLAPQDLRYIASLSLRDNVEVPWCVVCLERNRLGDFSAAEKDLLILLREHLQNLGAAFFTIPRKSWRLANMQQLTPREHEVAVLLYSGYTPADIERRLGISRRTVYEHVRHIHRKLGVKNAQELMLALARLFG